MKQAITDPVSVQETERETRLTVDAGKTYIYTGEYQNQLLSEVFPSLGNPSCILCLHSLDSMG